ncbi:NlpC/P60 family protein [Rhodobacter calidifons]|uniref:Peptidase n=1 Tax=Rhodobacter calidifons TaxID=2715277 RepID=A0ABX0GA05_9RHOB|nr:NlpC/P60 family protein [Rhodobacter calidifons]NHB77961.1 peptidase [Rhodobacter calidifons]
MTVAEAVLAEARLWLGTPYQHQASIRAVGADCLGLLRGIWRKVYGEEPEPVPAYTEDWAEPDHREVLLFAAHRWLQAKHLADAAAGDVLLFRMREGSIAKHLGIQSHVGAHPRFIHSYTGHGVIESSLSMPWQRRIAARFCFPEGAK